MDTREGRGGGIFLTLTVLVFMLVAITPINLYLLNPITHYINIIIYERLNNNINNSQSLIRIYIGNKRILTETIYTNKSFYKEVFIQFLKVCSSLYKESTS